jgi:hypothetical protein
MRSVLSTHTERVIWCTRSNENILLMTETPSITVVFLYECVRRFRTIFVC